MTVPVPTAHELYFGRLPADAGLLGRLEDAFFNDIWVRHGTSKTTYHHRLDDLNELVTALLPAERPLDIMDVAVSSGISTVEWMRALECAGIEHRMVAGDAVVDTYLISAGNAVRALVDRTGYLMQLDLGGRAIRMPRPRCIGRMRYLRPILLARCATRLLEPTLRRLPDSSGPLRSWGMQCRAIKLVSRSLLERSGARAGNAAAGASGAQALSRAEIVEDDILRARDFGRRFHVVRAANILNRRYFDEETLRGMLINLRGRLRPQGLLVICRTQPDGRNDATVYRLEPHDRLAVAARLNEGCEVAELVEALNA